MPTDSPLEQRVRARLAELERDDLRRTLRSPSGIDLGSNDYLKLSSDPRVAAAFAVGIVREGVGSTGSRLLRGQREAFDSIEQRFARFKRAERSLYFSSGYLANLAVLTALAEQGDAIFSDRLNHASLIDGMKLSAARGLVFPHNDVNRLADLLDRRAGPGVQFVVVESLFSMDGDVAPLGELADVCRGAGAVLIVDEAHAVGIYGQRGSGLVEEYGVADDVCITVDTAGKALGVGGAFVSGPSWAIDLLVQRARSFLFSTAPPPAVCTALETSLSIVEGEPERREKLRQLSSSLRRRLSAAGFAIPQGFSQIIPLIVGDNRRAVRIADLLQQRGFDVRAIRPPTVPEGSARLRISVNTGLTDSVLEQFVETLTAASVEAGLWSVASS